MAILTPNPLHRYRKLRFWHLEYLLHRHCSKKLFKKAVRRICPKKIYSASLYSVCLGSVHFTPCMYMHGFTLV